MPKLQGQVKVGHRKSDRSVFGRSLFLFCRFEGLHIMSEKTAAALERLEAGLVELIESGDWSRYLKLQSKLHRYSFNNTLLILMQYPEATQVMGFKQWQKLGRQVRKGEKGIQILAPCKYSQENDEGEKETRVRGFKISHVFDISQTDGEAIAKPTRGLEGSDDGLFDSLCRYAKSQGIEVVIESLFSHNGSCQFKDGKATVISISADLAPLHRAKTIAHELGHALLHGEVDYRAHRPICELEAESTAFVVLDYFGLDTGDYSFGYIARWKDDDTIEALKKSGQTIQKAAAQIIDSVEQLNAGEVAA